MRILGSASTSVLLAGFHCKYPSLVYSTRLFLTESSLFSLPLMVFLPTVRTTMSYLNAVTYVIQTRRVSIDLTLLAKALRLWAAQHYLTATMSTSVMIPRRFVLYRIQFLTLRTSAMSFKFLPEGFFFIGLKIFLTIPGLGHSRAPAQSGRREVHLILHSQDKLCWKGLGFASDGDTHYRSYARLAARHENH